MKRPSIKVTLISLFAVFGLMMGFVIVGPTIAINQLNGATDQLASNVMPTSKMIDKIKITLMSKVAAFSTVVIVIGVQEQNDAIAQIAAKEQELQAAITDYSGLPLAAKQADAIAALKAANDQLSQIADPMVKSAAFNKVKSAKIFQTTFKDQVAVILGQLDALIASVDEASQQQVVAACRHQDNNDGHDNGCRRCLAADPRCFRLLRSHECCPPDPEYRFVHEEIGRR